jgi:hypothetical protein
LVSISAGQLFVSPRFECAILNGPDLCKSLWEQYVTSLLRFLRFVGSDVKVRPAGLIVGNDFKGRPAGLMLPGLLVVGNMGKK